MRVVYLLMFSAILSACNTFNVVPEYSPNVYLDPPHIQHWQKANMVGRTNIDKRWQDFQDCGVRKYFNGALDLNNQYPGMTGGQVSPRRKAIESCMVNKGYIFLSATRCVDNKNKKLTGLCN